MDNSHQKKIVKIVDNADENVKKGKKKETNIPFSLKSDMFNNELISHG